MNNEQDLEEKSFIIAQFVKTLKYLAVPGLEHLTF